MRAASRPSRRASGRHAHVRGVAIGALLGGYVFDTAGAAQLWLPARACGAIALLLLPVSMAAERRAGPK